MDVSAQSISRCRLLQTLKPTDNVMHALDMMTMLGVTSVPVVEDSGKAQGFFDALDAVCLLVKQFAEPQEGSKVSAGDDGKGLSGDDLQMLSARADKFLLSEVDLSAEGPHTQYIRLSQDSTGVDLVKAFQKGVHRVGITDNSNNLIGVVSQSDLIAYLHENRKAIPPMRGKVQAGQMKLIHKNVASVSPDLPTWKAFQELQKSGRTAVAIKDADGKLTGVFSSSDCKYVSRTFQDLLAPVSEYVAKARRAQSRKSDWIATMSSDAPMTEIIETMCFEKVHRVFVVDDEGELKSIITATDVIRELFD